MSDDDLLCDQAVAVAARLLRQSQHAGGGLASWRERRLRRVLGTEAGTRLAFALADRALRPVTAETGAAQLATIAEGDLGALGPVDRALFRGAARLGTRAPDAVMAAVTARLDFETRPLIWSLSPGSLARRLRRLQAAGRRANVNVLGEAILGDAEAGNRVTAVERLLARPEIAAVSVKVSAVAPSLSLLDEDGSVERASAPLRRLYRAALAAPHRPLVNLDMEEHRDLDLTVAVFRRILDEPEFERADAGIALQAYLPDTHAVLDELLDWSARRFERTGAAIRVRLVKGANLAVERVEAELHGWPPAPYPAKADTDASYLLLLDELLRPQHTRHTRVGVASHNLFDVGAALAWAAQRGVGSEVEIEMLAGMADRQADAVVAETGRLLVYVPATDRGDYRKALAYLARRLDENSTPEGFLRHALDLSVGNPAWEEQRARFVASVAARRATPTSPFQTQDRAAGQAPAAVPPAHPAPGRPPAFANEVDTDLTVPANRRWARRVLAAGAGAAPAVATVEDVDAAVDRAGRAARSWAASAPAERRRLLHAVAAALAARRGEALGVMAAEAGKTFAEGDPEVSEAVDYAGWYAEATRLYDEVAGQATPAPLGVVTVAPPWNFPIAIPAGGVFATLAAGGAAILKPSPEAPRTAAVIAAAVGDAGAPDDLVQLVAAPDDDAGRRLIEHPGVGTVILTGAWATAAHLPALATGPAPAGRDQRQERHGHHRHRRCGPGRPRPGPFRVRPRRPEVLGGEFGHRRRRAVRRLAAAAPARRRRAQPPGRAGDRPRHRGRSPGGTRHRSADPRPDRPRPRRVLAGRAPPRRQAAPAVVARGSSRGEAGKLGPHHRVVRARPRRHARP